MAKRHKSNWVSTTDFGQSHGMSSAQVRGLIQNGGLPKTALRKDPTHAHRWQIDAAAFDGDLAALGMTSDTTLRKSISAKRDAANPNAHSADTTPLSELLANGPAEDRIDEATGWDANLPSPDALKQRILSVELATKRIQLEKLRGSVVERSAVDKVLAEFGTVLRSKLEAVPSVCIDDVLSASDRDGAQSAMEQAIRDALEDLTRTDKLKYTPDEHAQEEE